MSDERAYPAWGYCTHPGFWYQGYWCCLDEQCEYRYEPVPAGHDGYSLAAGPGADGENSSGDETFGYGEATVYDEWGGDHQPGSEQGQDASQYVQQYDNYQQPVPPSDVATTGSGSSMAGNPDENTEDRTWPYVQEDNRDGQDVDEAMNLFPEYPAGDTHYPRELSIENEPESAVNQSNIEERPDLGPR